MGSGSTPATGHSARAGLLELAERGFGGLSIAGKLWCGFGLILGVALLGVGVTAWIAFRVQSELAYVTSKAEPLNAAAYQMEVHALGAGLNLISYLRTTSPSARERLARDISVFREFQRRYDELAPDETYRRLGAEAARTFEALVTLGYELIDAKDRKIEAIDRYDAAFAELDRRPEWAEVTDLATWIALELRHEESEHDGALYQRLSRALGRLASLVDRASSGDGAPPAEARSETSASLLASMLESGRAALASRRIIAERMDSFEGSMTTLNEILDARVRVLTQHDLEQAEGRAFRQSTILGLLIVLSSVAILAAGAFSVLVIGRGILRPVAALSKASREIGAGRRDHRVAVTSRDEIGLLAKTFNEMAGRLQASGEELEAAVRARTADLRETKRALEEQLATRERLEQQMLHVQKMESIGTLAGGIAHEFNNMLYVMIGSIDLATTREEGEPHLRRQLERARQACERSRSLVGRLLSFSRQDPLDPEPVDSVALVEEAVDLLRGSIPASVVMETRLDPTTGTLVVDRGQIQQVILNLGLNACQAMPGGKGRIEVDLSPRTVDPGAAPLGVAPGDYALLSVADNGRGIAPEVLPRVLDPFFTTKAVGEGTGLGLSVAHGIVTAHGGGLRIDSEPGRGTTVEILLPRRGRNFARPPAPGEGQGQEQGRRSIP